MSGERGISGYTDRVREAIYEHVFSAPEAEVGGVLVGSRLGDGHSLVSGSVRANTARGDLTTLTFTHEAWEEIHASIARDHADREIVGWYHSHPGHGIFLSGHDKFIHQNFFSDPACLALVIDPLDGSEGLFGWDGGEIADFWVRDTSRPGLNQAQGSTRSNRSRGNVKSAADQEVRLKQGSSKRRPAPQLAYAIPTTFGAAMGAFAALALHALAGS